MQSIARRKLIQGGAALAVVAAVPATAEADGMAGLERLIEAHRAAYQAFCEAIDREQQAENAYKALGLEKPLVPSLLCGGKYELYDRASVAKSLRKDFDYQLDALRPLARIAPEIAEQARKAFEATLKENMRVLNKVVAEEERQKNAFGLTVVKRDLEAANRAEEKTYVAVCAHQCRTIEEARRKAEYLKEVLDLGTELQTEHMKVLLNSFLEGRAAS
jgi:hypothetical protein